MSSLEAVQIEIDYLKKSNEDLRQDVKELTKAVQELNTELLKIQVGWRWLLGMLSAAAVAGALVDHLMKILRVY